MPDFLELTVVMPVRNEERFVVQTLEALVAQDYPKERYEIIVVDGDSTDDTRDLVERFASNHPDCRLRLLHNPGRLSSRARNLGARAARGRLIAVIDGHVYVPTRQLFATMIELKRAYGALCLARPAPLVVPELGAGMPLWIALARRTWLAHSRSSHIYSDYEGFVDPVSSGFAYDRSVFDRVGYFDESFDAAEDVEFHHRLKRAGIQAYSSPHLTIYSYPRSNLQALFRQMTRYGVGRAQLIRKHPDAFTKETLIPAAVLLFVASLPAAAIVAIWSVELGLVYAAMLLAYCLLAAAAGISATRRYQRTFPGFLVAAAIGVTHLGLGWGFCKSILRRRHVHKEPQAEQVVSMSTRAL